MKVMATNHGIIGVKMAKDAPKALAEEMKKRGIRIRMRKDAPRDILNELNKLRIKMRDVLAAYDSVTVAEGWTDSFGRIPGKAAALNRSRLNYVKRLHRLALDLENEVLPVLVFCRDRCSLDMPGIESIPAGLRNMERYLRQSEVQNCLGKIKKYSRRGPRHSTLDRDVKISLLCRFFEKHTNDNDPCHKLVAKIMDWQLGTRLSLNYYDEVIKKAKVRGNIFPTPSGR